MLTTQASMPSASDLLAAPADKTVLIVDDDLIFVQRLTRYVNTCFSEYEVCHCRLTSEALNLCTKYTYCVVLIDFNLPDATGTEFLCELQAVTDGLPPPAIVLTAENDARAAGEALRANAYDFLPKNQVSVESLQRSITNALTKHSLQESVNSRTRQIEEANRSLEEKNRQIQEFYQTVSHEVKTPLSASREFVSLVRDGVLGKINDEQAEVLDYALSGCDQIATHFNDLIEMTRLDTRAIKLHREWHTINSVFRRAEAGCTRQVHEKNIVLSVNVDESDRQIFIDGDRINQVISNLLSNAIKYTSEKGRVELSCRFDVRSVIICVRDNGCGIEDSEFQSIFKRLYQINRKQENYAGPGLGLGLSIAREIVHLHDGKIWVDSTKGIGSKFFVELPHARHIGY